MSDTLKDVVELSLITNDNAYLIFLDICYQYRVNSLHTLSPHSTGMHARQEAFGSSIEHDDDDNSGNDGGGDDES